MPIINSLLDTDFYIPTMAQTFLHNYPAIITKSKFKCRDAEVAKKLPLLERHINKELNHLCNLGFSEEELKYLSNFSFFKPDFLEFLRTFQLNRNYIDCYVKHNELYIDVKGPEVSVIWFEIPVLAIVSELYTHYNTKPNSEDYRKYCEIGINNLSKKIEALQSFSLDNENFKFADFGTRRRFSKEWHSYVINTLVEALSPKHFVGTSNVLLAKENNIKPIGTMAHRYIQSFQQLPFRLEDSQKAAFETWVKEYRGELGIALTDTVGFDAFLKDFDLYFAKLFDGCRHDSGSPWEWCNKLIDHYRKLKIDPKTKTAVFSDGLTIEKMLALYFTYHKLINISFGIGTDLTNDCGFKAPQIVLKMVECNNQPVAKISDSKGKGMCEDPEFESYLKKVFKIR